MKGVTTLSPEVSLKNVVALEAINFVIEGDSYQGIAFRHAARTLQLRTHVALAQTATADSG